MRALVSVVISPEADSRISWGENRNLMYFAFLIVFPSFIHTKKCMPLADEPFYFNSIHERVLHLDIEIKILSFQSKGEK